MAVSLSRFQRTRCIRRGWLFERVGWLSMAAIIAGAAIGLFGNGWLSSRAATGGGQAAVLYPRFARAHTSFVMAIDWQGEATLSIDRAYLAHFAITEIRPTPVAETVDADRIHYTFERRRPGSRMSVELELRARRGGRVNGRLQAGIEPEIAVRQFIFP
jgi:hypothetical protein